MNRRSQTPAVLILDDSEQSAMQLRDLLAALPETQAEITVHQSNAGVFPATNGTFDLVFIGAAYAHSALQQIVEIARFYQPHAAIVLLTEGGDIEYSPQQLINAAHAGLGYCLKKEDLSVAKLQTVLQVLLPDDTQSSSPAAKRRTAPGRTDIGNQTTLAIMLFAASGDDFVYANINRAAAIALQLNPQQLIGKRIADHEPRFENFSLGDTLRQVYNDHIAHTQRVMRLDDAASVYWNELTIQCLPTGDLLVEMRDIGDQVEHETEQRYSEQIWQDIAASLPDLALLLDENGLITRVIAGDWQQLGIDSAALPGTNITDLLLTKDREQCLQSIQKTLNTGKTHSVSSAVDNAVGHPRLNFKIALLDAEVNAPRQVLWIARETTEIRNEIEPLINDRELLDEILNRAPFAIAITDMEGRYERVNPFFAQLVQQPIAAVVGKTTAELFGASAAQALQELDRQLIDNDATQEANLTLEVGESERNFRVIKIPLHGMSLFVQNIVTLAIPLRDRKETAVERQSLAPEKSAHQLVEDVVRDFQKVLLNLTEHTRVALDSTDVEAESESTKHLRALMKSSLRARDLMLQMLTLQNREQTAPDKMDLTLFMTGMVALLSDTLAEHLQVSSDLQQNIEVQGLDPVRLQSVVVQLFRLAEHSLTASGHIAVCMRLTVVEALTCSYCDTPVRGQCIEISLHDVMHTRADARPEIAMQAPKNANAKAQIEHIHELLAAIGGHLLLLGGEDQDKCWSVLLPVKLDASDIITLQTIGDEHTS